MGGPLMIAELAGAPGVERSSAPKQTLTIRPTRRPGIPCAGFRLLKMTPGLSPC